MFSHGQVEESDVGATSTAVDDLKREIASLQKVRNQMQSEKQMLIQETVTNYPVTHSVFSLPCFRNKALRNVSVNMFVFILWIVLIISLSNELTTILLAVLFTKAHHHY